MSFSDDFRELTGHPPFPWQESLSQRFIANCGATLRVANCNDGRPVNIPSSCHFPTGLGKTSVVAIWLIALANHPDLMPRRLVYVVNRRTVVDQTTTEVEKLRDNVEYHTVWICNSCSVFPGLRNGGVWEVRKRTN